MEVLSKIIVVIILQNMYVKSSQSIPWSYIYYMPNFSKARKNINKNDVAKQEKKINRLRELNDTIKCNIFIIGISEGEEREKGWKYIWTNNSWKLPKSGEGNRNQGRGSTENTSQNQPKEVHTKIHNN